MSSISKQSFFALMRGSWESTQDERPRLFTFVILFVIAYTLDLFTPWAIGYTLGVFVQYGPTPQAFQQGMLGIAAYTALRLLHSCFHHLARYVQNSVAYGSRMHTLSKIFGHLMSFPLKWHISHHSGESLSKLQRSAGAVESVIGIFVWQIIEGSVKVVVAGIALFTLDLWVAANVLAMSALTIGIMILFNKKLAEKIRRNNTFLNKLNRITVDYMFNIVTVKMLGVENSAKRALTSQRAEGLGLSQKVSKYMELMWGTTGIGYGIVIGSSLLIYFYGHRNVQQAVDVAQVYVLLNYLDRIFQAIGSFTGYYSGIIQAATAYEDASEIIDEAAKTKDLNLPNRLDRSWTFAAVRGLNFTYVTGERVGLNNIDLEIRRGEKIALVGHSGSGKSTLLKTFGGMLAPDTYSFATNIQPSVSIDDFTRTCLLIPQEPEIFSDSVLYNLTMGEEFESKEISFFISLCKADQLLEKLPQGLDSSLAEKGLNLSVGEKQRLALARGLLRASGKDLLLLDEPTSSLDPKTEKEIFLALLYHFTDRTVISSCHRLNLIPLFDKIVFMSGGAILESGTFDELIEKRSHFYRAWDDYERNIKKASSSQKLDGEDVEAVGANKEA